MLKKLKIKNFKGWKDTKEIKLAPITLFFGTNSSGKSSIGQFLMMLKQTVESSDRKNVFFAGDQNSYVQLGSLKEMVYQRNLDNKIEFEYQWNLPKETNIKDSISKKTYNIASIDFSCKIYSDENEKISIEKFNYNLFNYNSFDKQEKKIGIKMSLDTENKNEYKIKTEKYKLKRNKGRVWNINSAVRFYGFSDKVVAYYQNADFVQDLNLEHENFFKSINYLGPLRTKTDRLYSWSGNSPESVGASGENTIPAILSAKNRKISLGRSKQKKIIEEIVAKSLKKMGLIENFRINKISKNREEYEVNVKTKGSKHWVDLPDVGFGISQVLPVLVQCFYAPKNSIIVMEQPEIHLHPSAQSVLADVMIDVINSKENGKNRNIQLIIETHSEHFLRRLQRRIAEDTISQDKVSAYFAKIDKSPAKLEPLDIDLFGNILNWPKNFFGDEMEDVVAQSKAAVRKQMKKISDE